MDYEGLLGGLNPTEDDRKRALHMGLLHAGLGILANNQQRNLGPALGAGGMMGLQGYNQGLQQAQQQRMAQATHSMKMAEMARAEQQRSALANVMGGGQGGMLRTGGQPSGMNRSAAAEYLSLGGDPVKLKALRDLEGEDSKPHLVTVQGPNGPVQRWVRPGEASGVDVGAPAAKEGPFEAGGMTAEQYRQFLMSKARTGAPKVALDVKNLPPDKRFEWEDKLRGDYSKDVKAYREVQDAHRIITGALQNPSAANDMAAATKFMKLLDPGSVVRESELAMAMQASGALDRMMNYHNTLISGQKLTPTQRKDFAAAADLIMGGVNDQWGGMEKKYDAIAQEYGLKPDNVKMGAAPKTPGGGGAMNEMPPAKAHKGKVIEDDQGKRYRSDGMAWKPI